MRFVLTSAAAIAVFANVMNAQAQTWVSTSLGGNDARWSIPANWDPNTVPNAESAAVTIGTPSGTRNLELDGQYTVGSMTFNSDGTNTQTIRAYNLEGDLLTFNAPGSGPVAVTVAGTGRSNNRLQADMYLADNVILDVQNTRNTLGPASGSGDNTSGTLAFTGNATGPGGVTKAGPGTVTVAANAGSTGQVHAWEGPTLISGGRWRTSLAGTNGMVTSSFTVNGGQLAMISNGSHTFGPGPLNLNGFGATSGPLAGVPGAIRPDTGFTQTITNDVVVQSDASIAMYGSTSSLTLSGTISGESTAKLYLDAVAGDPTNHGTLIVTGANTYAGGTDIVQGTFSLSGSAATAGTGNVFVDGISDRGLGIFGTGKLDIQSDVSNGIADDALVTLTGGTFGGQAILGAGINELIGGLVLGGVTQTQAGTYGSTASGADFQFDQYFSGLGVFTIPGSAGLEGDYNNDGFVNAADYVLWRKTPGDFGGDPTGYNTWKTNFGMSNAGSGGAVPEPGTVVFVALGFSLVIGCRRQRS